MPKEYEVGYRRPPKHTRFKKGRSGNPKGRSKGRRNNRSILRAVLERKVTIRENGEPRQVEFIEAFVHKLVEKALNGTASDQIKLMQVIDQYAPEMLRDPPSPTTITVEFVDSDGNGRPAKTKGRKTPRRHTRRAETAHPT